MKTVVKGKYIDGVIRLPEGIELEENADVYLIVEGKKGENILDETFGIWIDEPDFLEKLRKESEIRIKALGVN